MFAFMEGMRFVVVIPFDIQMFPKTFRFAPSPAVLMPTLPDVPYMAEVLSMEITLALVAKIFGVEKAFEDQIFPETFRFAPSPAVLMPTLPDVPYMAEVLRNPAFRLEVVTKTF